MKLHFWKKYSVVKLKGLILYSWRPSEHICVSKLTIIGSDNSLVAWSPGRRQAIIWTNTGMLLIGPWGTNFINHNRNLYIFIQENAFEMSSGKWWPFCLGLNVIICIDRYWTWARKGEALFKRCGQEGGQSRVQRAGAGNRPIKEGRQSSLYRQGTTELSTSQHETPARWAPIHVLSH